MTSHLRRIVRTLTAFLTLIVLVAAPAAVAPAAAEPGAVAAALAPNAITKFRAPTQIGHGWSADRTITAGDWNRDGHPDLILRNLSGDLMLYPGRGSRFSQPVKIGHGWNGMDLIVGGVDWNRDGNPDLIARHANGTLYAYFGNGSYGFSSSRQIGHGWQNMTQIVPIQHYANNQPAIVTVNASGRMSVYATENQRFYSPINLGTGWNSVTELVYAGNWDREGSSDLLAIMSNGDLRVYSGAGNSFAATKIGHGWSRFSFLTMGPTSASTNTLWGVRNDGTLWSYPATMSGVPIVINGATVEITSSGANITFPGRPTVTTTGNFAAYGQMSWPSNRQPPWNLRSDPSNGRIDSEMCTIPWMPSHRLHCRTIVDTVGLNWAYRDRFGTDMPIDPWQYSTYRTYDDQIIVKRQFGGIASTAGSSPHGWGHAIDYREGRNYGFGSTINNWLRANGPAYGWELLPWHEEDGAYPEYWHFDYTRGTR